MRLKNTLLELILITGGLISIDVAAQNIVWEKSIGGSGIEDNDLITQGIPIPYTAQQTSDGGYIIGGYTASNDGDATGNHGGKDILVVKLDSAGTVLWSRCFGSSSDEYMYSIQQTSDNGYILAGGTGAMTDNGDVIGTNGVDHTWIVRLNPDNGGSTPPTIQWQKILPIEMPSSIRLTPDGGYIIGTHDGYGQVVKLYPENDGVHPNGTIQWQTTLNYELLESVQTTNDGGYIVIGISGVNPNTGNPYDYEAIKFAPDTPNSTTPPAIQWTKYYGGSNNDVPYSIQQTADGGYIIAGSTSSPDNGDVVGNHGTDGIFDLWIVKLDSSGNKLWAKCYGGTDDDEAYSIQQTPDGGYIVAGDTYSTDGDLATGSGYHGNGDYWVVKLDSYGNISWQKCYGGADTDMAYSIQQITGGYILAGLSLSNSGDVTGNHGSSDIWVTKLDNSGLAGVNKLADKDDKISVYPNPFHDEINLKLDNYSGAKNNIRRITLKDIVGRIVYQSKIINTKIDHLSDLRNGVYFMDVDSDGGMSKPIKVVKE